jgi:hypothetical protein
LFKWSSARFHQPQVPAVPAVFCGFCVARASGRFCAFCVPALFTPSFAVAAEAAIAGPYGMPPRIEFESPLKSLCQDDEDSSLRSE